jgi:hypothetical protein
MLCVWRSFQEVRLVVAAAACMAAKPAYVTVLVPCFDCQRQQKYCLLQPHMLMLMQPGYYWPGPVQAYLPHAYSHTTAQHSL